MGAVVSTCGGKTGGDGGARCPAPGHIRCCRTHDDAVTHMEVADVGKAARGRRDQGNVAKHNARRVGNSPGHVVTKQEEFLAAFGAACVKGPNALRRRRCILGGNGVSDNAHGHQLSGTPTSAAYSARLGVWFNMTCGLAT